MATTRSLLDGTTCSWLHACLAICASHMASSYSALVLFMLDSQLGIFITTRSPQAVHSVVSCSSGSCAWVRGELALEGRRCSA